MADGTAGPGTTGDSTGNGGDAQADRTETLARVVVVGAGRQHHQRNCSSGNCRAHRASVTRKGR